MEKAKPRRISPLKWVFIIVLVFIVLILIQFIAFYFNHEQIDEPINIKRTLTK
jgi:hypothetical protein